MKRITDQRQRRLARPQRQHGFSLVEILVAALLLAIGMLALVGVQAAALRLSKEAQFRSTASELAIAFAAAVKANVAGAQLNAYDYTAAYAPADAPIPEPTTCRGTAAICTPQQVAADDIARWRNTARVTLPGGSLFAQTGAVAAGGPNYIDLWVIWRAPQADDAQDAATAQLNVNCPAGMGGTQNGALQCYSMRIFL